MTGVAVVAAVMTYNRRDTLARCLRAIRAQTTAPSVVLVVDNASTDGTPEMLAHDFPEARVMRTAENLGCSGAMHVALREARALAPDYVWLLDDDAIPFPHCLERLLEEAGRLDPEARIGALRPMIQDPHNGQVKGGGISCGGLLRGEMVATVPLPLSELFIELSDHAYNMFVRRAGWRILRVPAALAHHPLRPPGGLRHIARNGYPLKPWRAYYAIRNRIYASLRIQPSARWLVRNLIIAARMIVLLTLFGRPRRGQWLVVRGVVDGVLGQLGRRVEPGY
jgi:GT2 family glycosyltransferase